MKEDVVCLAQYINEIKKKVNTLSGYHQAFLNREPLIAFRGESKEYGITKLTPSLFRERTYVEKEEHLFELFCDYSIVSKTASNVEKAIETQHYASISRMLDISFDVLVALYFACANVEEDGYIYIFAFPEHYSPHSKYVEDFYTNILEGKHIAYSRNFMVFSHSYSNERIKAQKGGFIFFPGKDFQRINECYYERVRIDKNHKKEILNDLNLFFQVNTSTLFPEKDRIAEVVKEKFKSNTYSSKKVTLENEIDTLISRIDYELKIIRKKDKITDKKEILRWLRKEQDDITNYVKQQSEQNRIDELCLKIERDFKILKIRYREAPNGK